MQDRRDAKGDPENSIRLLEVATVKLGLLAGACSSRALSDLHHGTSHW